MGRHNVAQDTTTRHKVHFPQLFQVVIEELPNAIETIVGQLVVIVPLGIALRQVNWQISGDAEIPHFGRRRSEAE